MSFKTWTTVLKLVITNNSLCQELLIAKQTEKKSKIKCRLRNSEHLRLFKQKLYREAEEAHDKENPKVNPNSNTNLRDNISEILSQWI